MTTFQKKRSLIKDLLFSILAFNLPVIAILIFGSGFAIVGGYVEDRRMGFVSQEPYVEPEECEDIPYRGRQCYGTGQIVPGRVLSFEQYAGEIVKSALDTAPKGLLIMSFIGGVFGFYYHKIKKQEDEGRK